MDHETTVMSEKLAQQLDHQCNVSVKERSIWNGLRCSFTTNNPEPLCDCFRKSPKSSERLSHIEGGAHLHAGTNEEFRSDYSAHLHAEISEEFSRDYSTDDDTETISPLLSFVKRRGKITPSKTENMLISESSYFNISRLCDDRNERVFFSEQSDVRMPSSGNSGVSDTSESSCDNASFSSISSAIAHQDNPGMPSFPSDEEPPSSLFELANSFLKNSSGWDVKPHGNSALLANETLPKPTNGVFIIPQLTTQEPSDSCKGEVKIISVDEGDESDDWKIDLSCALRTSHSATRPRTPVAPPKPKIIIHSETTEPTVQPKESLPCLFDASNLLKMRLKYMKKRSSPFGKALCRRWKDLAVFINLPRPKTESEIKHFLFDTPSPDDTFLLKKCPLPVFSQELA